LRPQVSGFDQTPSHLHPHAATTGRMNNTLAISLVILIIGFLALDHYVLHWEVGLFALRWLIDVITTLAFWR